MASSNIAKAGGYDCQFVDEPPSDLKCLICLCVAKDPLQHGDGGCGKIFCRQCLRQLKRNHCPNCRRNLVTFKDERRTITVELLNQLEDKNHYSKTETVDGYLGAKRVTSVETSFLFPVSSMTDFIPHSKLTFNAQNNCQYLKDDCLVFRVFVKTPTYKPWLNPV